MQHQFQYVVEGKAEYTLEDQPFLTEKGDLVYHGPGVMHRVSTLPDEPYLCISIVFHFGDFRSPLEGLFERGWHVGRYGDQALEARLTSLISHYHQPAAHHQLLCQGLLLQIIHQLHEWTQDHGQTRVQEKTRTKLVLIRNHIAKHYRSNIRHEDLERISGLSRNYIIVKFRKAYGMTPFEYLTAVRIKKAKELAVQSNLSVGEIARLVGYSDVHTFGRVFKSKVGTSLSQFCSSLVAD
jgi:AraC-like DNA-binding protein